MTTSASRFSPAGTLLAVPALDWRLPSSRRKSAIRNMAAICPRSIRSFAKASGAEAFRCEGPDEVRGRLVPRSHSTGIAGRDRNGRRQHAAQNRRRQRTALAQAGRVVDHARRQRAHHRRPQRRQELHRRRRGGRSLVFPGGDTTLNPGPPPDGCEFLLAFPDGSFSESSTFLLSEVFARTPKDVLSANFGVPEDAFDRIPKEQLFIFEAPVPGPIESDAIASPQGTVPQHDPKKIGSENRQRPGWDGSHRRHTKFPHRDRGRRGDRESRSEVHEGDPLASQRG
jgi:hypothetical protein